jgi:hypothetical protein
MELGLNLLWFLIAVASFVRLRGRTSHTRGRRHPLIALGCTLALLFPVVSITDDLHADQAIIEDSSPSKRTLKRSEANHNSSTLAKFNHPPLARGAALFSSLSTALVGRITPADAEPASLTSVSPYAGRAPPFLS